MTPAALESRKDLYPMPSCLIEAMQCTVDGWRWSLERLLWLLRTSVQ